MKTILFNILILCSIISFSQNDSIKVNRLENVIEAYKFSNQECKNKSAEFESELELANDQLQMKNKSFLDLVTTNVVLERKLSKTQRVIAYISGLSVVEAIVIVVIILVI